MLPFLLIYHIVQEICKNVIVVVYYQIIFLSMWNLIKTKDC